MHITVCTRRCCSSHLPIGMLGYEASMCAYDVCVRYVCVCVCAVCVCVFMRAHTHTHTKDRVLGDV